jgi:serine/threonine protein phosphatase PrpC
MPEPFAYASGLATDTGLCRGTNEDAAYAGRHLFAVADGFGSMGLGGEVASAAVIDTLTALDTEIPAGEPVTALERQAVAGVEPAEQAVGVAGREQA